MQSETATDGIRVCSSGFTVEQCQREYATYSVNSLKAELLRLINFSVENLVRMASIVAELDGRGVLLGSMNISIMPILRMIAKGRLLPDIVVKFSGEYDKIKKAGRLTMAEQREIASGAKELPEPAKRVRASAGAYTKHLAEPLPFRDELPALTKGVSVTTRQQQIADAKLPPIKESPRDTAKNYWLSMSSHPNKRLVLNHFFRCLIEADEVDGELARLMRQFSVQV